MQRKLNDIDLKKIGSPPFAANNLRLTYNYLDRWFPPKMIDISLEVRTHGKV